ncbi:NTP transferase domain-containing protein [Halorubrum pallidum]
MCGGRGTRLGGDTEKPLVRVAGRSMVDRVLAALAESRTEAVRAVVSPHATATRAHLAERAAREHADADLRIVDAPGDGYVADLRYALTESDADAGRSSSAGRTSTADPPVLTVAADLPLLDGEAVDRVLDAAESAADSLSLTVCVPADRKRELGVSADGAFENDGRAVVPAGINVVGGRGGSTPEESGDAPDDGDAGGDALDATPDDGVHLTDDRRLAVNVNYPSDVRIAEALLAEGRTTR